MKSPASRFTRLIAGLGTAATVVAALAPNAANASDGKDYTALGCLAYSSSIPPIVTTIGIYNNQAYTTSFMCPAIHDEGGSGLSSAVVYYTSPTVSLVSCGLYSTSPVTGSYRYQNRSAQLSGRRALYFAAIGGYTNGLYSIVCSIPPGGQLHGYTINEG